MSVILGIDASLNSTGIAIYSNNKIIFYDTINHPKNACIEDKFRNIGNYIEQILKAFPIELAVIEEVYSRYAGTAITLSKVHGTIIRELDRNNIKYLYYDANTIKKTLLGKIPKAKKGEVKIETKPLVAQEVFKTFPEILTTVKDDITDAAAIVITYLKGILPNKESKKKTSKRKVNN